MAWFVYHICKKEDIGNFNLGYIGVTQCLKDRFDSHSNADSIVGRAIRKYHLSDDNMHIITSFETSAEAYLKENELRPNNLIGWNIMAGGKGYTDGHIQDPYTRYKISQAKKGKSYRQPDEHYKKCLNYKKINLEKRLYVHIVIKLVDMVICRDGIFIIAKTHQK